MEQDEPADRDRATRRTRTSLAAPRVGQGSSRGGGPRLNAAEWITLLDIHQRYGGAVLGPAHPELIGASRVLSNYAASRGSARGTSSLRSPEGLARRLATFRGLRDGSARHPPSVALDVWDRLGNDPETCRELALTAQTRATASGTDELRPSHGPKPWVGDFTVSRTGGAVHVYLMVFETNGLPVRRDGLAILKIGMSRDLARREAELNRHIPAVLELRWRRLAAVELPTADDAWAVEQALLKKLGDDGRSLGREFAMDDETRVVRLLSEIARATVHEH